MDFPLLKAEINNDASQYNGFFFFLRGKLKANVECNSPLSDYS